MSKDGRSITTTFTSFRYSNHQVTALRTIRSMGGMAALEIPNYNWRTFDSLIRNHWLMFDTSNERYTLSELGNRVADSYLITPIDYLKVNMPTVEDGNRREFIIRRLSGKPAKVAKMHLNKRSA